MSLKDLLSTPVTWGGWFVATVAAQWFALGSRALTRWVRARVLTRRMLRDFDRMHAEREDEQRKLPQ